MATIRNLFFLLILTPAIIYGGIKTYLYFQITRQVDQFVQTAAPFVSIEYGDISTTLEGVIFLENITFRPTNIDDEISINSIGFVTPGLGFLFSDTEELIGQGEIPEKMGISLRGIQINLTGDLVRMLTDLESNTSQYSPETGLVCTLSQSFQAEQYKELGLDRLVFDMAANMKYDKISETLNFIIDYTLHDIENADVEITVENINNIGNIATGIMAAQANSPFIKSIRFHYRPDAEFIQKTNQYCATLKQISVEAFIDQLVNQSNEAYMEDLGFIPGLGIRSALKSLLTDAGEVRIAIQPDGRIDPRVLNLYKTEDIPKILGLTVFIDGGAINDLSFTLDASSKSNLYQSPSEMKPGIEDVQQTTTKKQQDITENKRKYHIVQPSQLTKKIGYLAHIETRDGKSKSGRIIGVEDNKIKFKIRMHGGTFTIKIPIAEIMRSEVLD